MKILINSYLFGSSDGTDAPSRYYVVEAEDAKGYRWVLDGFQSCHYIEAGKKMINIRANSNSGRTLDVSEGWSVTHPTEGSEAFYETYA